MVNKKASYDDYRCEYCGANLKNEVDICPVCGSSQNIFREDKYKWRDYYMQDEKRICVPSMKSYSKEIRKESYYHTLELAYELEKKWQKNIKEYIDEKYNLINELKKYDGFDENDYNEFKNMDYETFNSINNFPNYFGVCFIILLFFLLVSSGTKLFFLLVV